MGDSEVTSNSFTGSYAYTLDAKGRVNIPAKMRKALGPANDRTFVATRSSDPCIILYPVEVWKRFERKLTQLNRGRALNRHYVRNIVRHAEFLQYDQQGRVALPIHLVDYAGIDKNIEIVGVIDRIEIWHPERLKEYEAQMAERYEELEAIGEEISFDSE